MNIDSILKSIRGIVRLRGGTDNAIIGNVTDKLKTFSAIDPDNNAVTVDNTDTNPVPVAPTEEAQEADLRLEARITVLLNEVLCELKIHTLHLEQITEERFTKIKGVGDDY